MNSINSFIKNWLNVENIIFFWNVYAAIEVLSQNQQYEWNKTSRREGTVSKAVPRIQEQPPRPEAVVQIVPVFSV